jgi:nucleolar protein 14
MGKQERTLVTRKPDLNGLMNADVDDEQAKADLLSLAFELLGKYAICTRALKGSLSCSNLFYPFWNVLK